MVELEAPSVLELFSKPMREAISRRGFLALTKPQKEAIPHILRGDNVLLIAPSGTGKTEAAMLPIFDLLLRSERPPGIKLLYITPLRALNRDLLERLEWWCKALDLRIAIRHGDTEIRERAKQALAPPDILITTPETLQAILVGRVLQRHLGALRWVVVDEVHELINNKRGSQLAISLERLRMVAGHDFQIVGLSATVGSPEEVAKALVGEGRKCVVLRVPVARMMRLQILYPKPKKEDIELAARLYTYPDVAARLRVMRELIENHRSTLLFTNTRSIAEILASRFRTWDLSVPISIHHGSLSKPSRLQAEGGLKGGTLKGVVCTSSLELGIDVGSIELVIQYNSPRQVSRLVQRVGRSGHWLEWVAKGVIVCMDSDDLWEAAVIARRSLREDLEPIRIPSKPLDALAQQIAGLLIQRETWSVQEMLELIRKAYPYRDLSERELREVLAYMSGRSPRLANLSRDGKIVSRPLGKKPLYNYYFSRLSMIPEERQYLAVDEATNIPVGLLDEVFLAEHGEPGTRLILAGSAWKILHIHENVVYLKPEEDPTGAIPSWAGEEIPVPLEVAMEVGAIRREVNEAILDHRPTSEIVKELTSRYPVGEEEAKLGISEMLEQLKRGLPLPTDRRVTVEGWEEMVIVNCTFGLLVNRTIARLLAHLLSERIGASVGVHQDPYRIVLKSPDISPQEVVSTIRQLAALSIEPLLRQAAAKTGLFKRRFVHVARRFGAIEEGAELSSVRMSKLLKAFEGTVVYEEALKETLFYDFDLEGTQKVMNMINRGEITIEQVENRGELTPISRIGIIELTWKSDIVPPERMKKVLIESMRARIMGESKVLACADCWKYCELKAIKDIPRELKCPACGSRSIGAVDEDQELVKEVLEKVSCGKKLAPVEARIKGEISKTSKLVAKYGLAALAALSARGLAASEVEFILHEEGKLNQRFFELLLEAERQALRRRFLFRPRRRYGHG